MSAPTLPVPLSTALPSHNNQPKQRSKGIKAYPDGWWTVLNTAKDIVRGTVLIKNPFPSPNLTHITANEAFHEAVATECGTNGLILKPGEYTLHIVNSSLIPYQKTGFSWSEPVVQIVSFFYLHASHTNPSASAVE